MHIIKKLYRYWNLRSGVILMVSPEEELHFIEIKGLFLFKLISLIFLKNDYSNYKFAHTDNWARINRFCEYKNSEDPDVREMFKNVIKHELDD